MAFDIVCMQFDKTGQNQIAPAIQGTGWYVIALGNITNDALFYRDGTGEHLICKHELRIGEAQIA